MKPAIAIDDWLHVLRHQYLDSFIQDGGGAVKIVLASSVTQAEGALDALHRLARRHRYFVPMVDTQNVRADRIDAIYAAVAHEVRWADAAWQFLSIAAVAAGLGVVKGDGREFMEVATDQHPSRRAEEIQAIFDLAIEEFITRNADLSLDFRRAMAALCTAVLEGGRRGRQKIQFLERWLTCADRKVAALREFGIHKPIGERNARIHLESLLAFQKLAGHAGSLLVVDASHLTAAGSGYSRRDLIKAYEVLREFVDSMERLRSTCMVIVGLTDLMHERPEGRGIGIYHALYSRLIDDVYDVRLANPYGSLVRLSPEAQPA